MNPSPTPPRRGAPKTSSRRRCSHGAAISSPTLDLVFFDTTSVFFTGDGGETLGQYGKSKDHRSDCKQMVLGMVIDGDGIPVCSEMWPGNTTDVTTLDRVAAAAATSLRGASGLSGRRCRHDLEEA